MNVKCEIPIDLLRFTVRALDDLAVRLGSEAATLELPDKLRSELVKELEEVEETANFYQELHNRHLLTAKDTAELQWWVYIVQWTDHSGEPHELVFDNKADAEREEARLSKEFPDAAVIAETEVT